MNIEQQRAACAEFMGWRKAKAEFSDNDFWLIPNADGKTAIVGPRLAELSSVYSPDLDDPASREQANELWKKLIEKGYYVTFVNVEYLAHPNELPSFHAILYKRHGTMPEIVASGIWWNAALVQAVAKLQEQREVKT